jgi:hypothetical protein
MIAGPTKLHGQLGNLIYLLRCARVRSYIKTKDLSNSINFHVLDQIQPGPQGTGFELQQNQSFNFNVHDKSESMG